MLHRIWLGFFLLAFLAGLFQWFFHGDADVFQRMVSAMFEMAGLTVELALCVAGGAMAAVCAPVSPLGWTLAVWMFFLLQALYFVIIDIQDAEPHDYSENAGDPFERACSQGENILAREAK